MKNKDDRSEQDAELRRRAEEINREKATQSLDLDGNCIGAIETAIDIRDSRRAGDALQQRTHELGERVKELNCLYSLSCLAEKSGESIEVLMQGAAELLPPAWQYPPIACARITFNGQTFSAARFEQTPWRQKRPIRMGGAQVGSVEVCYLEARPDEDEGPFLRQEGWLLEVVAERLGSAVERIQALQALRQSEARTLTFLNNSAVIAWLKDEDGRYAFLSENYLKRFFPQGVDWMGKTDIELWPRHIAEEFLRNDLRVLEGG